jgi:hypothetical protein
MESAARRKTTGEKAFHHEGAKGTKIMYCLTTENTEVHGEKRLAD